MGGKAILRPGEAGAPRIVLAYPRRPGGSAHETASQDELARRIALLLDCPFLTEAEFQRLHHVVRPYCVPAETLTEHECRSDSRLAGIGGEEDFFGGRVPHEFVSTKAISHPLIDPHALRPEGWSAHFGARTQAVTLRGFTAFSKAEAYRAGCRLLEIGPVRLKPARGKGGRGQRVLRNRAELDAAIQECDIPTLVKCGIVLEENLEDVRTYSVGQVQVGRIDASYVGHQTLTPDRGGQLVYGGSDLRFARGLLPALLTTPLADDERKAATLAAAYDQAAVDCYPGLLASRRNYDVACGIDGSGAIRFGVLEQSWRAGGASMAEACALEAFHRHPALRSVHAFTRERYGETALPGPPAQLVYRGDDEQEGPMIKYAGISSHGG
ncbi:DUF3182 family protein [Castellaniella ginsengisoli]|uniref:DUF3182 family protein n=1 Tax=Castellaniella ginsengisoli TaxID=546114 RepID=A0AB39CHM0_9BURK